MDIDTYLKLHGGRRFGEPSSEPVTEFLLKKGMLQFTPETAHQWCGPFEGGFACFKVHDYRHDPRRTLISEAEIRKNTLKWLLKSYGSVPHPSKALRKRLKDLEAGVSALEDPSLERPISLYMYGNDDTSYTAFFATPEEALEVVAALEACQPIRFEELAPLGFVFTN